VGRELAWPTLLLLPAAYFGSTEVGWATLNSMNGVATVAVFIVVSLEDQVDDYERQAS
jgi:hypothetical protein